MKDNSNLNTNGHDELSAEVALREQIEKRAYHLWLANGGGHGEALRHWLQAESEVLKAVQQDEKERADARNAKAAGKQRSASVSK